MLTWLDSGRGVHIISDTSGVELQNELYRVKNVRALNRQHMDCNQVLVPLGSATTPVLRFLVVFRCICCGDYNGPGGTVQEEDVSLLFPESGNDQAALIWKVKR